MTPTDDPAGMPPEGWKRAVDPELGEFYDTTITIDGHELLALVVQASGSTWEGTIIDAAGVEVKTVRWANCSRDDAMQLIACEATYYMHRIVRELDQLRQLAAKKAPAEVTRGDSAKG